eukprot:TRINITY_DN16051_c0_g1_i1.p1 TRINITY_DN16051_c0_g1~~TRINITY_DN16051_c0_g1_i1.p1  ORF type:complete len:109 (+),score=22.79 TRINITY_DN16051_c0_g1_i1:163-489(+)
MLKRSQIMSPATMEGMLFYVFIVVAILPIAALDISVGREYADPGWTVSAHNHADTTYDPEGDMAPLGKIKPGAHRPTFVPPFIRFDNQYVPAALGFVCQRSCIEQACA